MEPLGSVPVRSTGSVEGSFGSTFQIAGVIFKVRSMPLDCAVRLDCSLPPNILDRQVCELARSNHGQERGTGQCQSSKKHTHLKSNSQIRAIRSQ